MSRKATLSLRVLLCAAMIGAVVTLPFVATRAERQGGPPVVAATVADRFGGSLLPAPGADKFFDDAPTATITVNNNGDTAVGEDGICTLREAITNANNNSQLPGSGSGDCAAGTAGLDTIEFNIGAGTPTISPLSPLPTITEALTINGNTGTATRVELNGTGAGAGTNGLTITAGGCTIQALVINRFSGDGIEINGGPGGNTIANCYIGTNAAGTADLGNSVYGVEITNAANNTIGGTSAAARNLISGNNLHGIEIFSAGATGNTVAGNYIGTDVTGTADLGNSFYGVEIVNAPTNTIGGTTAGARNLISGNNLHGVEIFDAASTGNTVAGNYIGTDVTGTTALGNSSSGVVVNSAPTNTIGGTTAGARNLISGNNFSGVVIANSSATGNTVAGNYIGTDVTGTAALGNSADGVFIRAANNTIGGTSAAARNIISGNNSDGVEINGTAAKSIVEGNRAGGMTADQRSRINRPSQRPAGINGADATGNVVAGNYIGTDVTGTAALGNFEDGVKITNATNNTVGGTTAGERNIISANTSHGVFLNGGTGNVVAGNYIGTDATGTVDLGNGIEGVNVVFGTNSTIGGTTAGAGNLISGNASDGVSMSDPTTTGNRVLGNSIFNNGALGIDLGDNGVTPNDAGDPDTGPNNFQNFPVLTSVMSSGGTTTIQGSLNSQANATFRIEFFSNAACDPSGNGEGQTFIGSQNVTTNASGNATINAVLPISVAAGQVITSTATRFDAMNFPFETSEFSACVTFNAVTPTISINDVSQAEGNGGAGTFTPFNFTVSLSTATSLTVTVNYQTANGTAFAAEDYLPAVGTVTFNPNETMKTVTVLVNAETLEAVDETFFVNLSNPTNATIADGQGLGTILNDDPVANPDEPPPPHAFAITNMNQLLSFNVADPGVILSRVNITGLINGESIIGIDFRPANGQLYGFTGYNRIVTINTATGAATAVASLSNGLVGDEYGMDFNPTVDRIRLVNNRDQNASVDPTNGTTTVQTPLNPGDPSITGVAYTNNFAGAATTTLYAIDSATDTLYTQNPPASGTLTPVGPLGVNTGAQVGFDITPTSAIGYASLTRPLDNGASLYAMNLATGEALLIGQIGDEVTIVRDITISTIAAPTIFGITPGNNLVSFNSLTPETASAPLPITGLINGENVIAIDYRPATGQLYGFTGYNRVVTINTTTGMATVLSAPVNLVANEYGFDFNPVPDRIRLVNDSDNNLRLNPDTGGLAGTDSPLAYAPGDPNFGQNPSVTGAAYTNNFAGATVTTLYDIDSNRDVLVTQGSLNGTPTSPNTGQLFTVGSLGFDASNVVGFDIAAGTGAAYASLQPLLGGFSSLYAINLLTGRATLIGQIGGVEAFRDIAVAPAGTFQFPIPIQPVMVAENAGNVTLTVTRTGDTALTYAAISFETVAGTAIAPGDFTQTTGTVFFNPGETSKMISIPITDDLTAEVAETFTVRLIGATNGYFNGIPSTMTVTITDND